MAMNLGNLNNFIDSYRTAADRARANSQQDAEKAAASIAFQPIAPLAAPGPAGGAPAAAAVPALAAMAPGGAAGAPPPAQGPMAAPGPVSASTGAPAAPGGPNPAALAVLAKLFGGAGGQAGGAGAQMDRSPMPGGMSPPSPTPATAPPPPAPVPAATGGTPDPVKESEQIITSAFKGLKAQNPGASPYVLSLAVQKRIEAMKGLAPLTKAAAQAQTSMLATTARIQVANQQLQAKLAVAKNHDEVLQAIAEYKANAGIEIADIGASSREQVGAGHDAATTAAAGIRAGAETGAAKIRAEAAKAVKGMAPGGRRDQAIIDGVAKITAAAAQSGADPTDDINAFKREVSAPAPAAAPAERYQRPGGGSPKPTPADIAYAKAHPEARDRFIAHFGQAAAAALK